MVEKITKRKLDRLRRPDRHARRYEVRWTPGQKYWVQGLMPNPETGTVTFDVAKAVQEVKAGKVEFRHR